MIRLSKDSTPAANTRDVSEATTSVDAISSGQVRFGSSNFLTHKHLDVRCLCLKAKKVGDGVDMLITLSAPEVEMAPPRLAC